MLKGNRIVLRALRRADLPKLCEFANNAEATRLMSSNPPIPRSVEHLEHEFDQRMKNGRTEAVMFVIEMNGVIVGQCGLSGLGRNCDVVHSCSLSIAIGEPDHWGQGIGRESIGLLMAYAFVYWNVQRIGLQTSASNERALRCYRRSGFVEEGRLRRCEWDGTGYVDTVCMSILREEWEALSHNAEPIS